MLLIDYSSLPTISVIGWFNENIMQQAILTDLVYEDLSRLIDLDLNYGMYRAANSVSLRLYNPLCRLPW